MKLIGILHLLSFCGHLTEASADIPKSNTLIQRIWITWNQLINNEFNPDVIYNTLTKDGYLLTLHRIPGGNSSLSALLLHGVLGTSADWVALGKGKAPEIIRNAGYPAESYIIMTKDGYLLTLHRIPGGNGSLPVLLLHGVLGTSADWVALGKGKALAYLLADQGYDVWLGNFRGNTHSRAHISLSSTNSKFWDFSLNELGIYDLPAIITFIAKITSQPLHTYIGYSMGTTCFYIMASQRPETAQAVQMMISLAPTAFISHIKSPIRFLVPFWNMFKIMMQFFFHDKFLRSDFVRLPAKYGCGQDFTKNICANIITQFSSGSEFLQIDFIRFLFMYICNRNKEILSSLIFIMFGYDYEQFNYSVLPVIFSHDPADSSAKTLMHYIQGYQSGKFRQYDYGRVKNLMIYNSTEPPDYNLANITVPIALLYSGTDWIISIEDIWRLYYLLPNVVDIYEVQWPNFNHVDFLWVKNASKLVYERVLKIMRRENLIILHRWNNITYN